ncbi:MAG: 2-C-methyl-D-erythritol 4-phosphate cytidylyltransferase [Verrucomicrobiales bacterium]|nr:2-C-methyl-D-erythritol 4-phosphate cytidylyltransferase [Verrucomicrobiales bacterium]MCP5528346.1 2-C-methyl-D-erythritol 4-phosphate cytidylyltransferase [Verrucomicrobiales bacterium]
MNIAIIVAAGRGARMGGGVDKLFLELAGAPVIAHTWRQFDRCPAIAELVFVVRPDAREAFRAVAAGQGFRKPFHFADGGAERQDSVWNGLATAPDATSLVAIHDGARPCVTPALIAAVLEAARETGAAVAASRLTDTVKESADGRHISRHLERDRLWAVQTPQAFRLEVIRRAIATAREQGRVFTDDTAACELIGQPVRLVAGDTPNPKVTTPHDLPAIERLLQH